ncbi:MAG: TIGR02996 domain-containing protein [Labilithrix sp.]
MSLAQAAEAIGREDWSRALDVLLQAWRETRAVRIADLVDRVASRLPAEPITAATVKARTAAWLELAEKPEPVRVGALLATPWPGKWQDLIALLDALAKFPEDPRIAAFLARLVTTVTFESRASSAFYYAALRIVARARDLRTRSVLEAELARARSRAWGRVAEPSFQSALEAIVAPPPLSAADETALVAVEALFAGERRAEETVEKSEADFLAAIHAAPDDDELRAVFADWLTERGDPRGELITLQLAPKPTPAAKKREAALLKKHGRAWAGPLDRVFQKESRVFTRGFLSRGIVLDSATLTASELAHPEWALVESLSFLQFREETIPGLLAAPWLRNLRSLARVPEVALERIAAEGLAPRLEELQMELETRAEVTPEVLERRRTIAAGFPRLRSFGIGQDPGDVAAYVQGPLPAGLERLVIVGWRFPLAAIVDAKIDVPILEAREWFTADEGKWRFELRRDEQGRFTRLRAFPASPELHLPGPRELGQVIRSLSQLTELVVEPGGGLAWDRHALATLETALTDAKHLRKIDVPWDREVESRPNDAPRIKLAFFTADGIEDDLDAIWSALASPPLSLSFDSMNVNSNGGHEPLPADGLAAVRKALAKKRTTHVLVYQKKSSELVQAVLRRSWVAVTAPRRPDFDLDSFLAWLAEFLEARKIDSVSAPFLRRQDDGNVVETYGKRLGLLIHEYRWITGFGPEHEPFYDLDELAAAARTLEGVRVVRTKRQLLVVFGDVPEEMPDPALRDAFEEKLLACFWSLYERKRGYVPEKLVTQILGPALEQRGFVAGPRATWTRDGASVDLELGCGSNGDVWLSTQIRASDGTKSAATITDGVVTSREDATKAIEGFAARMYAWLPK